MIDFQDWYKLLDRDINEDAGEAWSFFAGIEFASKLGFEYCSYGLIMPVPITRPKTKFTSNYPEAWVKRYKECGYASIDPAVKRSLSTMSPTIWTENLFSNAPHVLADARNHGLSQGWTQSIRDSHGTIGILSLVRGDNEEIDKNEILEKLPYVTSLLAVLHETMLWIYGPRMVPEMTCSLADSEKSVLTWAAAGKTIKDIAQIMEISVGTVNSYASRAVEKLNATSTTEAIAKAALLGKLG